MPGLLPSSRGRLRLRLSLLDVICAALAPPFALYLRDAQVLSVPGMPAALLYCGLSFVVSLIAFVGFRISHGISRYFSVHDAISITSAVIAAGLTTTLILLPSLDWKEFPAQYPSYKA